MVCETRIPRLYALQSIGGRENVNYTFFPLMFGIYPYANVTEKQKTDMKEAGIDYLYQSVYEIAFDGIVRLLGN